MSIKSVTRSRRLIARLGSVLAAALCVGSLAVFSPSASAATENAGITSGRVYRIVNLGSGKYLNVTGGRDQDNINVNQYTGDGTNTQDFIIRWVSAESCYKIYPICSSNGSGRVLHIARSGSAPANGGNAVIKTASSADAASQRFQIDTIGHELFYIRPTSKNSLYLTANGNGNGTWTGTGANTAGNVVVKTKSTGNNDDKRHQMWIIVEKSSTSYFTARFPFSDYANIEYYTKDGKTCPKDKKIHDSCNRCISFWNGSQCIAFSREVYARCFNGFRWSDTNATDKDGIKTSNLSELKTYIKNKVGYGGHIWVDQSRSKNDHSIIIADFNNDKVQVYDANYNGTCVIRYKWLTYAEFANDYNAIKYSHKGHVHKYDSYRPLNIEQHAKFCSTCDRSVYDPNTTARHGVTSTGNGWRCTICKFAWHNYEPWDTSTPEETNDTPAPEEPLEATEDHPEEPLSDSSAEISTGDSFTGESSTEDVSGEEVSAEEPLTENSPEETFPDSSHPLDPALLPDQDE